MEDMRGRDSPMPRPRLRGRSGKIGGLGLIVIVAFVLLGGDPAILLNLVGTGAAPVGPSTAPTQARDDNAAEFVSVVLADTEETWQRLFRQSGKTYRDPKLRLFTANVQSACGFNTSATGPFYCPPDERVYLDLSFFAELSRMGAPGDFAQAYVIGHEVAHHVQNLLGVFASLRPMQQRVGQTQANALQVLTELQADCYAGVWAHHADRERGLLEPGDLEEGLRAAASIGDDRLQSTAGRRVQPETFTHGSSAQRVHWFRLGLETGDPAQCDTFTDAGVRL